MRHVAIIGRPNVGKSALFNRLAGRRISIVHDQPGVTRDRIGAICKLGQAPFEITDTGGIGSEPDPDFAESTRDGAFIAMESSDAILFVVDSIDGLTPLDGELATTIRGCAKPVILVVNKVDTEGHEPRFYDFARLGFEHSCSVSAAHGRGIGQLVDVIDFLVPPEEEDVEASSEIIPKLALVGRPNVGKSSLVNSIVKDKRSTVSEIAGTTRDTVDVLAEREGQTYLLLDTAGIRPTSDRVEQLGIERSRAALAAADAVLLLFDLSAGWSLEDQALRELVPAGVVLLVAGNKADAAGLPVGLVPAGAGLPAALHFSALTGAGRQELVAELLRRCGAGCLEGVQVALNARQRDLAAAAALSLVAALEAAAQQLPWDFWTIDLRAAVRALGEITGEAVSEAVLDRVFSRFCIGK